MGDRWDGALWTVLVVLLGLALGALIVVALGALTR